VGRITRLSDPHEIVAAVAERYSGWRGLAVIDAKRLTPLMVQPTTLPPAIVTEAKLRSCSATQSTCRLKLISTPL
jgi:hypothetical protein